MPARLLQFLVAALLACLAGRAAALSGAEALAIARGDTDDRIAALNVAVAGADPALAVFVQALLADEIKVAGERVLRLDGDKVLDAATGETAEWPDNAEDIINNNRMRGALQGALAALQLASPVLQTRRAAVESLLKASADEGQLPLIDKTLAAETDAGVRELLERLRAAILVSSSDPAQRLRAAQDLGASLQPAVASLLRERLADGAEADPTVRAALASLPLIQVAGSRFSRAIHPAVLAVQAEQAELATVVEETVGGVRVVKGFGAEQVQADKLRIEADDIRRESINAARIRAKYLPAIELLPQVGLIAVLWFGGNRVIDGELTLGSLVQFNVYVALLVWPLRMIGMTIAFAQRAAAALGRVNEVLDIVAAGRATPTTRRRCRRRRGPNRGRLRRHRVPRRELHLSDDGERNRDERARARRIRSATSPPDNRWRSSARPGRASRRWSACSSGSTTSTRARSRSTVSTFASSALHELRRAVGIVFEDTLLFHDTVQANIAFADPTHPPIASSAPPASPARTTSSWASPTPTTRCSASVASRCRVVSASASRSPARSSPTRGSSCSTTPPRRSTRRRSTRSAIAMSTVMDGRTTIVIAHRPGTIALADTVVLLDGGRVDRDAARTTSCSPPNRATAMCSRRWTPTHDRRRPATPSPVGGD